jgi:NADPH:quinone reductase-like Zn-dependent oxidoreductase
MRAIVAPRYGPPEVLELREFVNFAPDDEELLVQVHCASVNALDWRRMRGSPFLFRFSAGLGKPKRPRLGVDFAGRVVSLGTDAQGFQPGEEVFGAAYGAFGEQVSAAPNEIARRPANVDPEAASTLGVAAFTALQALRDPGQVQPGHSVLINGAGGGVGTFAVQLAKWMGAEVTAVSRSTNLDRLRSIGADHVIDYAREDFTTRTEQFDLILDMHPRRSPGSYKRSLRSGGIALTLGFGGMGRLIAVAVRGKVKPRSAKKQVGFLVAKANPKDLATLADLAASGRLRPVIDRRYALQDVPEAIRYVEAEQSFGKVVINVDGPTP